MIPIWEAKEYQDNIDNAKYRKVGKNYGFHNLFLCRNESLHLAGGNGATAVFHIRMLSNFRDKDFYKLAGCHHLGNNIILLETLVLEHHKLEDLNLDWLNWLYRQSEFYVCAVVLLWILF